MNLHCELRSVCKSYAGTVVLSDFDLAVGRGEMVAITGASGSGKSTLLNLIGLLDAADSGDVLLWGQAAPRPRTRRATRLIRDHLGYLFQNFALIDNATVEQNLAVALTDRRHGRRRNDRFAEVLERVGLPGTERRTVYSLSGGEQQRVALARLLLRPRSLILADEPTGSLDASNRAVVLDVLREMNRDGATTLIATHDEDIIEACRRTVHLSRRDGRTGAGAQPQRPAQGS
ncbi:ATP-binding cassette domain-containing protein [uncultured Leifsonia sp.]|uniref:ATP-binding cassette domain-containing protein n=1 Tax=uncultured Leifsonia sp. TaxID=340359 RepID=UPI0028D00EC3|nr:ATP-binding cassette domain-containing protein [uncultured Leifsonia sp.]